MGALRRLGSAGSAAGRILPLVDEPKRVVICRTQLRRPKHPVRFSDDFKAIAVRLGAGIGMMLARKMVICLANLLGGGDWWYPQHRVKVRTYHKTQTLRSGSLPLCAAPMEL